MESTDHSVGGALTLKLVCWWMLAVLCGPAAATEAPAPAAPPLSIAAWIGTYGTGSELITLFERGGQLYLDGRGFKETRIERVGNQYRVRGATAASLELHTGANAEIILAGTHYPQRDVGAEVERRIRAGVQVDIDSIRRHAQQLSPPLEAAAQRAPDLVDLTRIVPDLRLDIRYATTQNFMGIALYEVAGAWLQRPAALALAQVAAALRPLGYGLQVFDAYRPWYVTQMFWEATPPESHVFVADPAQGSRHNRGCAVDLSLYRLDTGMAVDMPSRYDEMSARAYADYVGGTSRQRWARDLLRHSMEAQGFQVYPQEWWHFDFNAWTQYAIMNTALSALPSPRP